MDHYLAVGRALLPVMLLWVCGASLVSADEAEKIGPEEEAYLLWQEGYFLHLMGQYDSAITRFTESIANHPTAEAYTFRGWSLSMQGRLPEAISECKQAIDLDPEYGNPYNDIGVYLIDLGRPDEAIPWLKKAMGAKRYCCYQYPHFNLGRVLLLKGRLTEAIESFERALSYEPDYEPALKALKYIRDYIRERGLEAV
ncbi:MAG: tetratricopeptide repeat protein [Acidiferrobacterales bacterium]